MPYVWLRFESSPLPQIGRSLGVGFLSLSLPLYLYILKHKHSGKIIRLTVFLLCHAQNLGSSLTTLPHGRNLLYCGIFSLSLTFYMKKFILQMKSPSNNNIFIMYKHIYSGSLNCHRSLHCGQNTALNHIVIWIPAIPVMSSNPCFEPSWRSLIHGA